ncbi:uncharacterized protein SPSK_02639 [Sporothrix schenckii 1099-18]|uniref:Uncharacterized protein n=1 Tax=Sporothrix schenckii 1099-18 TaxID=1397361 RepID=A0A0F2M9M6_SPOSC|nr:uncharacterized protein SPSK_02639 [Sporothrix schenckii 1099-18]KJR86347.1 hypothetical protein SPSK_02639 [Sporothrix schenckii 1099-18]
MAPLIPRMHVFEIDDQPWFPAWCRGRIQAALTRAWIMRVPILQSASPASLVADVLRREVLEKNAQQSSSAAPWIMIDFCAGGGGPTPSIERVLNGSQSRKDSKAAPTQFVLTDLHPHVEEWAAAAAASQHVRYAAQPVDACDADPKAILNEAFGAGSSTAQSTALADARVCRLFSLAFHHFDDPLARDILKNTVETSDGFGIFELQDRSLSAFVTTLIFGLGILLTAPYYAWRWRSPMTLVFTYLIPILPFVLVFDGWMSMLRTRTPDEVEALLRTCGASTADTDAWDLRSGEVQHLWPCGYMKWIVCTKKGPATKAL